MTTLLLIRHGTNDWVHGRLAGWTPGVHLNEAGREQATKLAERLAEVPIDALYVSPLDRTVETAQPIAAARKMHLNLVEGLGEVRYGEWQGAELKELYKHELWPGVQFYPSGTRFPGGETLGEAQIRMVQTLDSLRARHPEGTIAVVSHADIIKLALAYYIGMHIDLFQRLEISPCSISAVRFTKMGPRLLAYNETGTLIHLLPPKKEEPSAEAAQAAPAPETAEQSAEQREPPVAERSAAPVAERVEAENPPAASAAVAEPAEAEPPLPDSLVAAELAEPAVAEPTEVERIAAAPVQAGPTQHSF